MKLSQKLLADISQVTREIEDKYPELQKYLDENPMTLPGGSNSHMELGNEELEKYLNSLKELVEKYKVDH